MRTRVSDKASMKILEIFRHALKCMNMLELRQMESDIIFERSQQTTNHHRQVNDEELAVVREEIRNRKK